MHLRQKASLRLEFLSTLGPNPTRKARADLQLWISGRVDRASATKWLTQVRFPVWFKKLKTIKLAFTASLLNIQQKEE